MESPILYLASASPRRAELLRQIGLDPVVRPARIVEERLPNEPPVEMARRLASEKGRSVREELIRQDPRGWLLAADTLVVVDSEVLGKPVDAAEAAAMLRRLRGRAHEVITGIFATRLDDDRCCAEVCTTQVRFARYDDAWIADYVATGEPMDKAGAYGIQGVGALLAEGIAGSWANVVGLPVERLPHWIALLGLEPDQVFRWRNRTDRED